MIELQAIRIDVHGQFEFRIKSPDHPPVITRSKGEAVSALERLGVKAAERLVDHSLTWGEVEISEPD